jgi:hypothetical protein
MAPLSKLLLAGLMPCLLLAAPARAEQTKTAVPPPQGTGVRCWITDPGKRSVVAVKGYYDLFLQPGQSVQHVIEIENSSAGNCSYFIYPGDGYNLPSGALQGQLHGQAPVEAGCWLSLEHNKISLAAKSRERVAFRLSVPADAVVGEHLAFVFIEPDLSGAAATAANAPGEAAAGVTVKSRLGVFILAMVGSPELRKPVMVLNCASTPAPELGKSYQDGQVFYRVRLENHGNVYLKPRVTFKLTDKLGKKVREWVDPHEVGFVCPDHPVNFAIPLSNGEVLPRGLYHLEVKVDDQRFTELHQSGELDVKLP